ncbi:unnamed protein product [Nippostrongylus brasiliensis]|uniref:Uncharacterized protein n=1 Tax=Nippostrongylus brasiliensis TaxID=27835 RepID=A0A0N4Y6C9_NIPBR|nr:unnamed protein product [Nippostrongylus brasiliensis]
MKRLELTGEVPDDNAAGVFQRIYTLQRPPQQQQRSQLPEYALQAFLVTDYTPRLQPASACKWSAGFNLTNISARTSKEKYSLFDYR